MVDRLTLASSRVVTLMLFTSLILASCLSTAPDNTARASLTVTPCVSPTWEANPYSSQPKIGASSLYAESRNNTETVRLKALSLLGRYAEHWSGFVDLPMDDIRYLRITVTYIDPVLLQTIVLNNSLSIGTNIDPPSFDAQLTKVMDKLSQRNELLFVVILTVSSADGPALQANPLYVTLPITQMELINSVGAHIPPGHIDPILNQNIVLTKGHVAGIIGYPIGMYIDHSCVWMMDATWNTTLTLSVPSVDIGPQPYASQSWSIPYRSLVMQDVNLPITLGVTPFPAYDAASDIFRTSPLAAPPFPGENFETSNRKQYWEDLGRYLWYFLIPVINQ